MFASEKPAPGSSTWFKIGLLALWLVSLGLRFWGLERFNTLVFDEVYYVKFAHNYLTQTPFFDGHPPLSKYLLALAIWLGNQLPIGQDTVNGVAGAPYTTWSYRWLNALTGSFIPLVVAGIAYQLTHRHRYTLLAGLFVGLDGLFLVESRYALNNVYLVILGLFGLWFLLLALNSQMIRRELYLVLAGIFFGATTAIKWNGLWFLLGAWGVWSMAKVVDWLQKRRPVMPVLLPLTSDTDLPDASSWQNPLSQMQRLKGWQMLIYLAIVPFAFYCLSWIPHLAFNTKDGFWMLQKQILDYHQRVGDGPKVHPYCSDWYTWLVMWRPVAYFYQVINPGDPLPNGTSKLTATPDRLIYDVHAMGNPMLWWLSTVAIVLVCIVMIARLFTWLANWQAQPIGQAAPPLANLLLPPFNPTEQWLGLFITINYAANVLPWVRVSRCTFLYHYMGASVFAMMALAWICDRWLQSPQSPLRTMGITIILLTSMAFIFWMPIYLGLPLSPREFQVRMWFPSWL